MEKYRCTKAFDIVDVTTAKNHIRFGTTVFGHIDVDDIFYCKEYLSNGFLMMELTTSKDSFSCDSWCVTKFGGFFDEHFELMPAETCATCKYGNRDVRFAPCCVCDGFDCLRLYSHRNDTPNRWQPKETSKTADEWLNENLCGVRYGDRPGRNDRLVTLEIAKMYGDKCVDEYIESLERINKPTDEDVDYRCYNCYHRPKTYSMLPCSECNHRSVKTTEKPSRWTEKPND